MVGICGIKKAVEVSEMPVGRLKQELKIGAAVTVSKYSLLKDYTYIWMLSRVFPLHAVF